MKLIKNLRKTVSLLLVCGHFALINLTYGTPTIQPIPPQTDNEGDTVAIRAVGFTDVEGATVSFSASGLPAGIAINTITGLISGTLGFGTSGDYSVTVTVTENTETQPTASTMFAWTVNNVNSAPVVTNPGPQTYQAGATVSLQITASDPDQDVLTYSAQNLPSGLSINPSSGLISGTIALNANALYSSTVTVSDGSAQTQVAFNWTITQPATDVTIQSPGNQTSNEGDTVSLQVVASSSDGTSLVYSATGLPTGLTIDSAGIISGALGYESAGNYNVTVTAQLQADANISASTTFNWTINNTNRAPVANAGPDENVLTGEVVTLDGSASSDPDGQMLTFNWRVVSVPAGSTVTDTSLSNTTTPLVSFTPDVDGIYTIDLEVSDGAITAIDSAIITATTPPNVSPNADAGPDQQVQINSTAILDGSASNDPDNYPQTLAYRWYFSATPAGSALTDANISNATAEQASFIPDVVGTYLVSLEVSDGAALATDQLQVTATYTNVTPIANAGVDQTVLLGIAVVLDGSGSSDPDAYPNPLAYTWSIASAPAGSTITNASISNANMAAASFIPDVTGVYLVRLDVSDGEASASDQLTVTVQAIGQVPSTPRKLKAKFYKEGVYLKWKRVSDATAYYVYRKTDAVADFIFIGQTDEKRFFDKPPYGATGLEYFIVAANQYGTSEPSIVVSTKRASYKRKRDRDDDDDDDD